MRSTTLTGITAIRMSRSAHAPPILARVQVSRRFSKLRLRVLQIEPHLHLSVHRRRGSQVLLGLVALAGVPVEFAEAEVAVGDKGTHPQFLGDGERVTVVAVGLLQGIVAGSDFAEE